MLIRVDVTAEDIADGRHCECCCPVARATSRALRLKHGVYVRKPYIVLNGVKHAAPAVLVRWLKDYDGYLPVKPFSFELEV